MILHITFIQSKTTNLIVPLKLVVILLVYFPMSFLADPVLEHKMHSSFTNAFACYEVERKTSVLAHLTIGNVNVFNYRFVVIA